MRMDVNQLAHQGTDFLVEIPKEREFLFVEYAEIIGIVFKERTVSVVGNQCILLAKLY